ncbi:MAG: FkbM family methyltransferase [Fuerstiella sp.]
MKTFRQFIRRLLHRLTLFFGFRLARAEPFERAIRRFELQHDDFYFVQIGAYNGVTSDPFLRFIIEGVWTCVLVEPQRRYWSILQAIYSDRENIACSNTAISTENKTAQLYMVREDAEDLPHWASQLASFRYDTIASHEDRIPNIRDLIVTQDVECHTLATLIQEHQMSRIDLLAIDVEGYDFEVVKQIDSLDVRPTFVYYEHGHLSDADYRSSLAFLSERGYRTQTVNEGDTFAELRN